VLRWIEPSILICAQVWTYLPVLTEGKQLLKAESVHLIGEESLQDFHDQCHTEGVPLSRLGPMGKVWESGVVQVVQAVDNLSRDTHPCNRLSASLLPHVAEVLYLPVYDRDPNSPAQGVVAALELVMSARSADVMVVANTISCVSQILDLLGLSVGNPRPQAATRGGRGLSKGRGSDGSTGSAPAPVAPDTGGGGLARKSSVAGALHDMEQSVR
jgi:hypothetical protein